MNEREKLLDRMIRIYGFEHETVIWFANKIENPYYLTSTLERIVRCHEARPRVDEEAE